MNITLNDAFDMGFALALGYMRPQTQEDSRAVGRLLFSDSFEKIHERINEILKEDGFDSFVDSEQGLVQCRQIITKIFSTDDSLLQSKLERCIHDTLSKIDVLNYLNMPDDTVERLAKAIMENGNG